LGVVHTVEIPVVSATHVLLVGLISVKSAKLMNFFDSFYFTVPADNADYNYFTDFVKNKMENLSENVVVWL
jgi:hypothetical protein